MPKNFTEEYIPINGIEHYILHIESESKDVLIMLHGGPGLANSCVAYYQQPHIDFCNVVYYDQRGAGKTQIKNRSTPESLSLDALLADLRGIIAYVKKKYDTNRIFLACHSWGSLLGTQYILTYPNDVAGYIGYGQGVPGPEQDRHYYEFVKAEVEKSGNGEHISAIKQVSESFPDIRREDYYEQYNILAEIGFGGGYDFTVNNVFEIYANSPTWTEEDELVSESVEKLNEKLYAEVLYDWEPANADDYSVPVYYILGRHDEMTSSAIAANYFETIKAPKKELYWIEDAGHLPDTDNPSAFFGTIKEIMAQL